MKQTVKTSRAAGQLEKMFRELNKHYFAGKLPEPIISLKKTPSAYGHITCSKVWQAGGENKYEINISSATLDRPIEETASTLLHEMVHEYCMETGIKDTSNNGVYHNRRFKEQAEAHGLTVDHHEKYGWTITSPSEELLDFIIFQGWQGYPDGRAAGMVGYGRHRSRQQITRQQSDRSAETSQGKEQHPAVGMSQVRYYHPEHQGSAGHLCGLHGTVREGRLITAGQRARARVRVVLYIKSQETPH